MKYLQHGGGFTRSEGEPGEAVEMGEARQRLELHRSGHCERQRPPLSITEARLPPAALLLRQKAMWAFSSVYPPKETLTTQEPWLKTTLEGLGFDFLSWCACVHSIRMHEFVYAQGMYA